MRYRVSSSIANFAPRLQKKFPDWEAWSIFSLFQPVVFFGMYHIGDVARLLLHRGKKTIFWCGSDILAIKKSPLLEFLVTSVEARHVCENGVEQKAIGEMGLFSVIRPQLFDVIPDHGTPLGLSGKKSVYLCAHKGREEEYGVYDLHVVATQCPDIDFHFYGIDGLSYGNIYYHGKVPHDQFVEEIKNYHCAIRLNEFDGFGEILARSALLGQYQISRIEYPHMFTAKDTDDLVRSLKMLEFTSNPNWEGRNYWLKELSKPLIV